MINVAHCRPLQVTVQVSVQEKLAAGRHNFLILSDQCRKSKMTEIIRSG